MGGFLRVKRVEETTELKHKKQRNYSIMANPRLNNEKEIEFHNRAMENLKRPVYGMGEHKCKEQKNKE